MDWQEKIVYIPPSLTEFEYVCSAGGAGSCPMNCVEDQACDADIDEI